MRPRALLLNALLLGGCAASVAAQAASPVQDASPVQGASATEASPDVGAIPAPLRVLVFEAEAVVTGQLAWVRHAPDHRAAGLRLTSVEKSPRDLTSDPAGDPAGLEVGKLLVIDLSGWRGGPLGAGDELLACLERVPGAASWRPRDQRAGLRVLNFVEQVQLRWPLAHLARLEELAVAGSPTRRRFATAQCVLMAAFPGTEADGADDLYLGAVQGWAARDLAPPTWEELGRLLDVLERQAPGSVDAPPGERQRLERLAEVLARSLDAEVDAEVGAQRARTDGVQAARAAWLAGGPPGEPPVPPGEPPVPPGEPPVPPGDALPRGWFTGELSDAVVRVAAPPGARVDALRVLLLRRRPQADRSAFDEAIVWARLRLGDGERDGRAAPSRWLLARVSRDGGAQMFLNMGWQVHVVDEADQVASMLFDRAPRPADVQSFLTRSRWSRDVSDRPPARDEERRVCELNWREVVGGAPPGP